jgi:glycerophosphoryl diester phosphodiesterase
MILPGWIGHRGVAGMAPENTLASVRLAARLGAKMVEFDTRLSSDGVPMIFHDDDLDRTSTGHGPVRARTAAQLGALDAGSWFSLDYAGEPIPTLAEMLGLCRDLEIGANIEIKPDRGLERETARAALGVALEVWPALRAAPLVSSFATDCLEEAQMLAPHWPRGWLVESVPAHWRDEADRLGLWSIHAHQAGIDTAPVTDIKAAGLHLLAYTVKDPAEAARLFAKGVDAVFADVPSSS